MSTTICFYEDRRYRQFFPLTMIRPVYVLRAGMVELFRRAERYFEGSTPVFICREQVAPLLAEQYRDIPVNIIKRGEGDLLFVNGRIRNWGDLPKKVGVLKAAAVFRNDGQTIAFCVPASAAGELPAVASQKEYIDYFAGKGQSIPEHITDATLYTYPWQLVEDIEPEIEADYDFLSGSFAAPETVRVHDGAFVVNPDRVYMGDRVEILPGAVIDASHGPVYIGPHVRVEPHAAITGPTSIGPNTIVLAGKITGSSIGHTCRVGGEVEESIFHAYVNKYHAGFIGHSYVAPWVNFGAMTTNSDLKNNYSSIRVTVDGAAIDSGSIKVGSFIGDHTKFGIGTLLNTGINIGVCCNIFGGTLVTDKEVPSFRWGGTDNWTDYRFDKALETARRTADRRNCTLSDHEASLLEAVSRREWSEAGLMDL